MDRVAALLDAHVAHVVRRLQDEDFAVLVRREVDHALSRAGELTLDRVVGRGQVKAVARKYVSTFELPGAIPEVVGDIATRLRAQPAGGRTLGEVIPRAHVEAVVAQVAGMRGIRVWIAGQLTESPGVQMWLAEYLRSLTTGAVDSNLRMAKRIPGVSLGLSVGGRLAGGAMTAADQRSREMAEKAAAALLLKWRGDLIGSLTDDDIAETTLGLWDNAARASLGDLMAAVPDDQLVDVMSIGYDLWLDLRTDDYLLSLVDAGVDYFFDTYGAFALDELLAEFGLTSDDLVEEALRFAPPAIAALRDSGVLDDLVRRQLAGFYESPEARTILEA